jgi:tRNA(Arg) A34 adenosine deaminase TadA
MEIADQTGKSVLPEDQDSYWMQQALKLADKAAALGEVPVGAVVVQNGELIGEGFNQPISSADPSAHAEIVALRDAARRSANYRLPETTLYVTIEPCAMCTGALVHARVKRLVYGACEPRAGMVESQARLLDADHFNHRIEYQGGVLADDCGERLSRFFAAKRR